MDTMTLLYIIASFAIGVVVGWITLLIPCGGSTNLTSEETRRLNKLINRAMSMKRGFAITLYSEGELIDHVTVLSKQRR